VRDIAEVLSVVIARTTERKRERERERERERDAHRHIHSDTERATAKQRQKRAVIGSSNDHAAISVSLFDLWSGLRQSMRDRPTLSEMERSMVND